MPTLQKLILIIIGIIVIGLFLVAQNERDIQSINRIFMPIDNQGSKIARPKKQDKTQVQKHHATTGAKTTRTMAPQKLKDPSEDIKKLPQMNF